MLLSFLDRAANFPLSTLPPRLGASFGFAWRAFRYRRRQQATIRVLKSLDDRTLKDIGLARNEIESVVSTQAAERRQYYRNSDRVGFFGAPTQKSIDKFH